MHDAGALPERHLAAGALLQPSTQIPVGTEEDALIVGDARDH